MRLCIPFVPLFYVSIMFYYSRVQDNQPGDSKERTSQLVGRGTRPPSPGSPTCFNRVEVSLRERELEEEVFSFLPVGITGRRTKPFQYGSHKVYFHGYKLLCVNCYVS